MRASIAMALAACGLMSCASSPGGSAAAEKQPAKSTPSLSREGCIFASVVDDWTPIDEEHLLIFGPGRHEAYLTTLFFPSPDVKWSIRAAIVDADHDGRICGFGSDAVVFENGIAPTNRVTIRSMQRIDKAQVDEILKTLAEKKRNKSKQGAKDSP
jgi:Family of unknown function (DUF6491)